MSCVLSHAYSRGKMAAFSVARSSCGLLNGLRVSFRSLPQVKHGKVVASLPQTNLLRDCRRYSVSHLSVKERIDEKRKAALVGGGQKRIDAQHKKVKSANTLIFNLNLASFWVQVSLSMFQIINHKLTSSGKFSLLFGLLCFLKNWKYCCLLIMFSKTDDFGVKS